jgi:hypothetical protein
VQGDLRAAWTAIYDLEARFFQKVGDKGIVNILIEHQDDHGRFPRKQGPWLSSAPGREVMRHVARPEVGAASHRPRSGSTAGLFSASRAVHPHRRSLRWPTRKVPSSRSKNNESQFAHPTNRLTFLSRNVGGARLRPGTLTAPAHLREPTLLPPLSWRKF